MSRGIPEVEVRRTFCDQCCFDGCRRRMFRLIAEGHEWDGLIRFIGIQRDLASDQTVDKRGFSGVLDGNREVWDGESSRGRIGKQYTLEGMGCIVG
jgi:hypothetical protein